jgi:predicted dienelactone hydrolase
VPAQAFTEDALIDLARASKFWPSASDVLAVVQPEANRLFSKVLAMERIARRKPPEAPKRVSFTDLSPEQKAIDDAKTREMVDRMKAAIAEREHRTRPKRADRAAPVSLAALMAGYQKVIDSNSYYAEAARVRLEKLKRDQ